MNDAHDFDHTRGHQAGKGQEMQVNRRFRQALVTPRQPSKKRGPKTVLDY